MTSSLFMLDLEGTLYTREGLINGALEAVAQLRELSLGVRFLTNTDSQSDSALLEQVRALGLELELHELFTPVNAAAALVARVPSGRAFVVGTAAVKNQLARSLELTDDPASASHVIVGDCRDDLDYGLLNSAFQGLDAGAEFIALQAGRFFLSQGQRHLDTGGIVAALEYASGRRAHVVGKPAEAFLDAAVASGRLPVSRADVWVVGDAETTDIGMGVAYGAQTVQVRTGKYQPGQGGSATHIVDSIVDVPQLFEP